MCGCCPPTVSALFCLWVRSGFSTASLAGALTFFPPEPALYKFNRVSKDGEILPDEPDEDEEDSSNERSINENGDTQSREELLAGDDSRFGSDTRSPSNRTGVKPDPETGRTSGSEPENDEFEDAQPALALTERIAKLKKKAKIRNARDSRDREEGVTYTFSADPRLASPPRFSGSIQAIKIGPEPNTKTYLAALLYRIRPERVTPTTKTIIYSHGNATDIGAMNYMQAILAKSLQANVLMYDYSGYGASGGVALESNTYRDIQMVYDWVVENVVEDRDESQIIIYGQSVGSGPSCYICAKKESVGGLILHSPFMSGMRVLTPSRALACLDIFPNLNRIKRVHCPVMIIHGAQDEEVDISHGHGLYNAVREDLRRDPWWVPDRGHNDITDGREKIMEYIERLRKYLNSLD